MRRAVCLPAVVYGCMWLPPADSVSRARVRARANRLACGVVADVMVPGRSVYVVEVSRPERAAYAAPTPKPNLIRRSLSFDNKHRGTVKRTFSFGKK